MPCTVSVDTNLFPLGLDIGLGVDQLAETTGIKSCFLHNQAYMSVYAAAQFAKQLYAAAVFTVGDFLRLTHEGAQTLPYVPVNSLDECLQRFPGLPENRHAARGTVVRGTVVPTCGGAHVAAARGWCHCIRSPTGMVWFCCAYHAGACGYSVMRRVTCNLAVGLPFVCSRPSWWCTGL